MVPPALGLLLLLAAGPAASQSLGQLLGTARGGSEVGTAVGDEAEREAVETARRSFVEAARKRADAVAGSEGRRLSEEQVAGYIDSESEAFVAEARDELVREKGDGLLTWSELTEELAELRDERLDALTERLRAAYQGADLPPRRGDHDGTTAWLGAMAHYILLDRNAPLRWLACLGVLAAGLVGAGFSARALEKAADGLAGRGAKGSARAAARLSGPLYLAATAAAVRIAVGWVWLPVTLADAVGLGADVTIAIALLWLAWNAADGFANLVSWATARSRSIDAEVIDLLRKGLRALAVGLFAAYFFNAIFGVELTSVLATLGVIGIVASIAAQDSLRNIVGAITVYGDQPFAIGDLVRIKSYLGFVEEIGFRSTRIRTLGGHRVFVPNAEVVREPIENLSVRPSVRHNYTIDLVYSTPRDRVERALEILEEILTQADPPEDQPPRVSFEEFGPHSLRLVIWYYSNTSDYWEARAHRSEVNAKILERFNDEGLEFAFPTRSLFVTPRHEAGEQALAGSEEEPPEEPEEEEGEEDS